jgi:hypothetical protein
MTFFDFLFLGRFRCPFFRLGHIHLLLLFWLSGRFRRLLFIVHWLLGRLWGFLGLGGMHELLSLRGSGPASREINLWGEVDGVIFHKLPKFHGVAGDLPFVILGFGGEARHLNRGEREKTTDEMGPIPERTVPSKLVGWDCLFLPSKYSKDFTRMRDF